MATMILGSSLRLHSSIMSTSISKFNRHRLKFIRSHSTTATNPSVTHRNVPSPPPPPPPRVSQAPVTPRNEDNLSALSSVAEMSHLIDTTMPLQRAQLMFDETVKSLCFNNRVNDAIELRKRVNKYRTRTWLAAIQILKSMLHNRESNENIQLFLKSLTVSPHTHAYVTSILRLLHKKPEVIVFWFNELFGGNISLKKQNNGALVNYFMHQFLKCGMLDMCEKAFNIIENPNGFAYGIAIQIECEKQMNLAEMNADTATIDLSNVHHLLSRFTQVETPDVRTYATILRTFAYFPDTDHNVNTFCVFFNECVPHQFKNDLLIAAFVFPVVAKWDHDRADEFVMEFIPTLNLVDEASTLRLLGSVGRCCKDAYIHVFLQRMQECNIEIGVRSLNVIMKCFFHQGNFESAQQFFQSLTQTYKIQPDSETANVLTKYFVDLTRSNYAISKSIDVKGELKRAEHYILKMGPLSQVSCKIFISAYLDLSMETEALDILNQNISLVNSPIISAFVNFYCVHNRIEEALEFMNLFQSRGVEITGYTQEIVVRGYLINCRFEEAHKLIQVIMESDTMKLLDKLALLDAAYRIFKDAGQGDYSIQWKKYKQQLVSDNREQILRDKKKFWKNPGDNNNNNSS